VILRAVSQENVETVQRIIAAWHADDLDAFLAELDADLEWYPSIEQSVSGEAAAYRGHDGAREAWREYRGGAWERLTMRHQEVRDLGESVLWLGHMDLTAQTTGINFTHEVAQLYDFQAGKVVRVRDFLTHAEGLEAAGLSE
jgi:ketosteroid isomerase-like protein